MGVITEFSAPFLKHLKESKEMKSIPKTLDFLSEKYRLVLLIALISVGSLVLFYYPVEPVATAQGRGSGLLRSAVAANSESELQKVESAYPGTDEAALARLMRGYMRLQAKDYQSAASLLADPNIARQSALGDYAGYYRGQALQELGRNEEAEKEYRRLSQSFPDSLMARQAALQAAGSAMMRGSYQTVIDDVADLVEKNDGTALKLRADSLERLGRTNEAIITLRKLYFDAPQSPEADKVAARLTAMGASTAPADSAQMKRRADNLFQAGLYALAVQSYDQLLAQYPSAATEDVLLRSGLSSYRANAFRQATGYLSRVRSKSPQVMGDALYYLGMSDLSLSDESGALGALSELRRVAASSNRIGDLLYGIGRYHEKRDRPDQAATYYSQLIRQFPQSDNADEAHYFIAWRAHQAGDFATSSRMLTEHVANYNGVTENRGKAGFWAALDSEKSGDKARALTLYRAMLMRYGAGWYGVNAERRISKLVNEGIQPKSIQADLILRRAVEGLQTVNLPQDNLKDRERQRVAKAEQLMRIAMLQSAMNELDAARNVLPNAAIVNLRIAQIFRQSGENVAAINALKRAYPDYGQTLPEEMSREEWDVFYPLKWWPTIREESSGKGLDPYLVAGIIRQETVFNAQARSRANALGLMQLLPSTGRAVARKNNIGQQLSTSDFFNPVLNIQLGTSYVKELLGQFGRFEYVAAAYNGGPTRVRRWINELPGGEIEEWVENIPLSETRLYVQGVYRNARQYQRLYDEQGRFRSLVPPTLTR